MSIDIKMFLEDCRSRGLTGHTIATYKSNIATFLNFVGNPLNVDTSILCKFLEYLKEEMEYKRGKITKKGVHPKTVKAYFSAISTYYDYLVFTRHLDISPIPSFTRRYLSRIKQQYNGDNSRQIISIDQMKQIINLDMPIQDKAILMILAKTGIRRGELISIDLSDINIEKKEIILKPKAKRTNRLVFFDDEISQVLRLFLEWRKARAKIGSLFISPLGFRMHKDDPNEIVAKYGSRSGLHDPDGSLNKKLTPHCFRHWFTTHLRRAGLPREFIQELRGDRRKDAIDIYDHIDLSELKDRYLKCIPGLLTAPLKLHETDLKPSKAINHKTANPGLPGERAREIFSILKQHSEGLTNSQIARLLKNRPKPVLKVVYIHLEKGNLQKDELDRYSLTSKGYAILERVTVSPDQRVKVSPDQRLTVGPGQEVTVNPIEKVTVNHIRGVTEIPTMTTLTETVTEIPSMARRPKKIISGFTVELYEFVKNNDGMTATAISKHFGKKNDFIRPYLHRLKDYGLIINDGGNWYPTSKEQIIESHFIKVNSTDQKAVLMEA